MIYTYYGSNTEKSVYALLSSIYTTSGSSLANIPFSSKVVIKPNIVLSKKRWLGANTRPKVVEALIRFLQDRNVRDITVADGSGVGNSASKAFTIMGYDTIAEEYGVTLLDIERDRFVSLPVKISGPFKTLEISRTVAECDILINIPVLKAHCQTRLTCALKNMKGVMPKEMKPRFHSMDLHRAIAQLNTVVKSDLILVDGAFGDLTSELGGTPVEMGIMAAGTDPLEVDVFASRVLGFSPEDIGYLKHYAEFRGVDLASFSAKVKKLNQPWKEKNFSVEKDPYERFSCGVSSHGTCCTCEGNLIFALKRLSEKGKLSRDLHFVLGKKGEFPPGGEDNKKRKTIIAVGNCAVGRTAEKAETLSIKGCPPETMNIVHGVEKAVGYRDSKFESFTTSN